MGYRAVFCDMDETFLRSNKSVPEENLRAVESLRGRGIEFVPCTGRHLGGLPQAVRERVRYAVTSSGAMVHDLERGSVLWSCGISRGQCRAIVAALAGLRFHLDIYVDGRVYSRASTCDVLEAAPIPEPIRDYLHAVEEPFEGSAEAFFEHYDEVERLNLMFAARADRDRAVAALQGLGGLHCAPTIGVNIEPTAAGATKGAAMTAACERLGIPLSETIAFGDSENDISMLRVAGRGIAVANAVPAAKDAADTLTSSCDEGGVLAGLRECGLL